MIKRNLSSDDGKGNENVTWKYNFISFVLQRYFAINSTRPTFTKVANYPGTKLAGVAYKLRKKMKTFTAVRSRSPKILECGHFTLLFWRGRQRNVPKSERLFLLIKPIVLRRCRCRHRRPCLSSLKSTHRLTNNLSALTSQSKNHIYNGLSLFSFYV